MFQKTNRNSLFLKVKNMLSIGVFALLLSSSASAVEAYKGGTAQIQSITHNGNVIELSNGSSWKVVSSLTFDPKVKCITCYIKENWARGDQVSVVPQGGNYGAYTHHIINHKDNAKAAANINSR